MERFDVGNVLPTKPGESRAEVLIKPHAVRGERIPQLPRKPSAADIPVGQDDRLSMVGRDQLAQAEDGRALIDHANVARDPKGPERALVVLALDDDWRVSVLLREILEEAQKDPNSPKALLLQDELRKVRKRRDQIFTYRERKLALLASSRASGAEVDVPNLPAQERGLFEGMVALLGKSRADAFGGSPPVAPVESPLPQSSAPRPEAAKKEPERMKVVRAEDTKRVAVPPSLKDHVLVHVLEDLPPFAGIDTTYRLKKEDVVTLPKTIAEILVGRGKARIVQMAGGQP